MAWKNLFHIFSSPKHLFLLLERNIYYTSKRDEREEVKTAGVDSMKQNISKYLKNTLKSEVWSRKLQNTERLVSIKDNLMKLYFRNWFRDGTIQPRMNTTTPYQFHPFYSFVFSRHFFHLSTLPSQHSLHAVQIYISYINEVCL